MVALAQHIVELLNIVIRPNANFKLTTELS